MEFPWGAAAPQGPQHSHLHGLPRVLLPSRHTPSIPIGNGIGIGNGLGIGIGIGIGNGVGIGIGIGIGNGIGIDIGNQLGIWIEIGVGGIPLGCCCTQTPQQDTSKNDYFMAVRLKNAFLCMIYQDIDD